ncbi:PH domain-containing protein [Micromonospora sonneratiae]|uniref:PH domain-containing protein n=1 Tax=Micromonospora sonneratiae TaxID=1184706 RepID=A0ABW3YNN8_9ACTN
MVSRRWRVGAVPPTLKLTSAALLVLAGALLTDSDPVPLGLAVLAAVVLAGWAMRDLLVPVRLALDPTGITVVTGYAGHRHLGWTDIERITVDSRPRFGLRTGTLEVDTGDSLHLFGRNDLGADPEEVVAVLQAAQRQATITG